MTWTNGISTDDSVNAAGNFLCQLGVISSSQNATVVYSNAAAKKDVALILYNLLFGTGGPAPSDYFPTPFIDLSILPSNYQTACKAMLYLDYQDGVAPFSRDYYFTNAELPFVRKGEYLRALFEAWNITPDWNNYNPQSNASSSFYYDVYLNDPNYGWIQKAYEIGLLNNLPQSTCTNTCFAPNSSYTLAQIYVLAFRLANYHNFPNLTDSSFFYPDNFSVTNINKVPGLDQAVFSSNETPIFNILGGGLPLSFSESYSSSLTELPFIPDEYSINDYNLELQAIFPLGVGWTHSYNISILSIKNYVGSVFSEQELAVRWADGSIDAYDRLGQKYLTPGVSDQLTVISQTAGGFAQIVEIIKSSGIKYHFVLEPELDLLRLTYIVDRNGNTITLAYQNGTGDGSYNPLRLAQVTDNVSSRSINFAYTPNTNFINSVTDPTGRTIYFNVDPSAYDLTSYYDANQQPTNYLYDNGSYKHLLTSIQRPNGNFTNNTYQSRKLTSSSQNGNYAIQVSFTPTYLANSQTSTSQVSVFQGGQALTTNYSSDSRGNPTSIISPTKNISIVYDTLFPDFADYVSDNYTGLSQSYQYDNSGNVIYSSKIANGTVIPEASTYNSFNEVIQHTDANGNTINYTYDNNGNLIRTVEPDSVITEYVVNSNGNPIQKIDPCGITTNYGYNQYGNLFSISLQGSTVSANASYDGASRVTSVTNPNGIMTAYAYDANNNITDQTVDPTGLNLNTHNTYDANGNLTDIRDPRQLHTTLGYDFNTDDLLSETYGSYTKLWTHNSDGTLNTYTSKNNFVFNYSYYPFGDARAGLLQSDGYANYDYNQTTRLLNTITRSGYQLTYGYDGFQRINAIAFNDIPSNTVSYQRDNNGNITQITYPFNTNWYITYEWNANNRLTGIRDWNGNYLAQYTYRKNGQLAHETYGNGTINYYLYDTIGRLDSIYTLNSSDSVLIGLGSTLDNLGNHLRESYFVSLSDTAGLIEAAPSPPLVYNYSAMNRLVNTDQGNCSDDNDGNLTLNTSNNIQYTWDEKDNLLSKVTSSGTKYCEYDPLESRRRYDTTRFALDVLGQSNALVETDLNGIPKALYVYGLGLVCRIDPVSNKDCFYHYDFRGSTVAITNDSQEVIAEYQYEPFGAIIKRKEPLFNNLFTYIGKPGIMRDDTDLYCMRARYYQPSIGRFISEDPVWSYNLFPYVGNNPVTNIDASGKSLSDINYWFWNHFSEKTQDKIYNVAQFLAQGKFVGTGIVGSANNYYEQQYINNYVKGKSTFWPGVGLGVTSLWTPQNFQTTIGAFTMDFDYSGEELTQGIGKTGYLKLVDMRSSLGQGLKTLWGLGKMYGDYDTFKSAFEGFR